MTLIVVTHPDCLAHDPERGYPERPDRLRAALRGINALPDTQRLEAREVTREQMLRVHDENYLDLLDRVEHRVEARGGGVVALDSDTPAGPGTMRASRLAAGACVQAVEAVLDRPGAPAFAVVRPPGHHAEPGRAMGFCFHAGLAIAAAHALEREDIRRVALCDFDVHHGNGTEAAARARTDMLFVSSHQMPLYPLSGDPADNVAGHIVNAALAPGDGSEAFRHTWRESLLPAIDEFAPDLVLVSAGFDAHARDPLAQVELDDEDFFWIGSELKRLADKHAKGRLAAALEGGYDLQALEAGVHAFARGISGPSG
ncbi:MAG: histone deacetylase family protein [Wenzhouxiangellaceae bacterium]|nr:histone deacetylase family protein [Wenzhouxiangellaceae bacterium]